ncbi:MAG TPA: 3'(2'),5'-bisphosphate nucleotidase CysQ [Mizugakiibacter sp.]|uniref:3'(2'),5'-bisphosphate nucleotidase CysQ n=1 Tax=Mizugakiibacter sediminis TaxID=1475481 RepID=A0A0K8QLK4_9GAMM|nr:3'(2'),5'-bisphosphate nucleotidase CysQ [Mizugakiibacter sediminis]GAP65307.1 3'(2'),5'-bisphosphate nucleotidase [Mizugakiibacter sediminis]
MSTLERYRREAARLARQAATAILKVYATSFGVEHKDDASPLTAADMAAHRILVDGLRALTPDIPVLSEESAAVPWSERRAWPRHWLVDPLDGTREFIKRNGEFTVNIALIEDHRAVLGIVLAPVSGELYSATTGGGAFRERAPGALPEPLAVRAPARPLVVAGSRSHGNPQQAALLAALGEHVLLPMGSSLKFCLIARGDADLYLRLGPTSEWDTAAAQCVLEEAGGAVLDLDGRALTYNAKESLLNPDFLAVGDPRVDWIARLRQPAAP